MSEWVKQYWVDWTDKTMYLKKVSGEDFEKKYNEMNTSDNKHIVATTILDSTDLPSEPPLFNVFIFYKDKFGDVKGL